MNEQNIQSLDLLPCNHSGLEELLYAEKIEKDYLHYLGQFLRGEHQNLNIFLETNPQLISTSQIKALFLLNLLCLGKEIKSWHISIREPDPIILDNIAYELIDLYNHLITNILFKYPINFYELKLLLPSIVIYYSDLILKSNLVADFKQVEVEINNTENFTKLVDESLISQQYRLLALYHRRMNDYHSAEQALIKYRDNFYPKTNQPIKLNKIRANHLFRKEVVLENLPQIYTEVSTLQNEVLLRSGIHQDTCFYFKCNDCCKKDFPTVSLTEFLYILEWIKSNHIDIKPLINKAKDIQNEHLSKFGTNLEIVDQTHSKDNPNALQFTCPMLDSNDSCSIHEARPLACRSFGLSTINGQDVQACKFYLTQFQYNSSHRNERDVYDSRQHTAMIGSSNEYLAQQYGFDYKQPVGTLVAWLTCAELKLDHLE